MKGYNGECSGGYSEMAISFLYTVLWTVYPKMIVRNIMILIKILRFIVFHQPLNYYHFDKIYNEIFP